jgi:hypothetical protein
MGIISLVMLFAIVIGLVYGWARLRHSEWSSQRIAGWVMLGLAGIIVLAFIDAHVRAVPTPFAGPMREDLPTSSPKTREPAPLELKADVKHQLDDVEAEHRRRMKKFESEAR